jgi:hypothetical protein
MMCPKLSSDLDSKILVGQRECVPTQTAGFRKPGAGCRRG